MHNVAVFLNYLPWMNTLIELNWIKLFTQAYLMERPLQKQMHSKNLLIETHYS